MNTNQPKGSTPIGAKKGTMPVLSAVRRDHPASPREIPMEWLNEDQAIFNHSQTLTRLKERGGMSCAEMWLNIHRRDFRHLPSESEAINYLNNRLNQQHE